MIVLNLHCAEGHQFEGWFPSSAAFETQCQQGLVTCAVCSSTAISRLPSNPRIGKNTAPSQTAEPPQASQVLAAVMQAMAQVAATSENVADQFPDEARKIHYGEAEARSIRGLATREETLELLEEGIPILPLPIPPKGGTH